jgi:hypothetical protein
MSGSIADFYYLAFKKKENRPTKYMCAAIFMAADVVMWQAARCLSP